MGAQVGQTITDGCTGEARNYELLRVNSYLKGVQVVLKCDVTLLSIYSSEWSQKGKSDLATSLP